LNGLRREFGNPMSAIASAIRGMFIAREGHELICADYNAVEARTVFWLAVDMKGLAVFQSGRDPYKDLASLIFGVDYNAITDEQRFLGKQAILGLGFRMGWAKFQGTCESYGVLISDELAQRTVNAYRTRYERVVKFWDEIETAALSALQHPGERFKVAIFKGFIEYFMAGNFLMCKLPSGRIIGYPDAEIQETKTPWGALKDSVTYMGMNSYTHQWERLATHGGTLVENITQAVARDLLAAAMMRLEKANYPIVLHVHDECISEVIEGTGNLDEYCDIMAANDSWAEGLPVRSEGWIGQRYRKG
jgi:DNA polymerase